MKKYLLFRAPGGRHQVFHIENAPPSPYNGMRAVGRYDTPQQAENAATGQKNGQGKCPAPKKHPKTILIGPVPH